MKRRYVTADVFSPIAFEGNPVAVVLDAEGLSTRQMQRIAARRQLQRANRYLIR
jgi:trans-2,3-dihydro-3-hydroxyanthranilate isomerase